MRNIVFIIPTFKRGGVERVTLNIINSLDYKLFNVHLLVCSDKENGLLAFVNEGVFIRELPYGSVRKALPSILKYMSKVNVDIVFTSFNHISLPILLYKTFFLKDFSSIVRLNSLPSNKLTTNNRGRLYDLIFKFFIKRADVLVSQSLEMTRDVSAYYNINENRILTIQNPVDIEQILDLAKEETTIVFDENYYNLISIGSLSEVKGFDLLIKAIAELKKKGKNCFRLYIVGDNREPNINYHKILSEMIIELDLSDCVYLLGFHLNPYPLLKQANAFVLSSRKEGFPNVVLEALVLDKPCLVTDCVDLSNVLSSNNSIVVEKNSSKDLERGLLEIVNKKGSKSSFNNFNFNEMFTTI